MTAQLRRMRVGVVACAAALLALAGCAAGQHAQTAEETPVVDGVAADAGPVALRAVTVAPPKTGSWAKGGDAPLQLVIVNNSRLDDQLSSVSTPVASDVRISPTTLNLPGGQARSIGFSADMPMIQLHDLHQQLFPAQSFPITFHFAKAGSVTFSIAVHLAPGPSTTPSLNISPSVES